MRMNRVLSMTAAAITVGVAPVAFSIPSASANEKAAATTLAAGCKNWTPHVRRVTKAGGAAVHSSYSGSSKVVAKWSYRSLFRVDKRCVNKAGNLWWHSSCCTGTKGYIWNSYTEVAEWN
ncbi:MAG: hypothetical protein ACRD0P_39290 [Stackebrandtia sp.]